MDRARSDATAAIWAAVAAARTWAGSVHEVAACTELGAAWTAKARADNEIKRVAEAYGRATGAQDGVDTDEIGRAVKAMRRAARGMRRAGRAFRRSARRGHAMSAQMMKASVAHKRAGRPRDAAMTRSWAARAREQALGARSNADSAVDNAKVFRESAGELAADLARYVAGECGWNTGSDMDLGRADMWEDAKQQRTESVARMRHWKKAVRLVARAQNLAAAASEQAAPAAAAAAAREDAGTDVLEAVAAWERALAAAEEALDSNNTGARAAGA